jgi:hypothetical protein
MPKHLRVKLATSTSVDVRQTSLAHFVANGAHYSQVDHTSGVVRFSPESKCCTSLVVRTIRVLSLPELRRLSKRKVKRAVRSGRSCACALRLPRCWPCQGPHWLSGALLAIGQVT